MTMLRWVLACAVCAGWMFGLPGCGNHSEHNATVAAPKSRGETVPRTEAKVPTVANQQVAQAAMAVQTVVDQNVAKAAVVVQKVVDQNVVKAAATVDKVDKNVVQGLEAAQNGVKDLQRAANQTKAATNSLERAGVDFAKGFLAPEAPSR